MAALNWKIVIFSFFFAIGVFWIFFSADNIEFMLMGFLYIGVIISAYELTKSWWGEARKEASKAEGSYPAGKLREYTTSVSKKIAEGSVPEPHTEYARREWIHKTPNAAKSLLSEFEKLFK